MLHAPGDTVERLAGPATRAALSATQAAIEHSLRERLTSRPISAPDPALIRYLVGMMGDCPREQVRVFYLDSGNHLLRDEIAVTGTPDHAVVAPRAIIARALQLEATALLLAHNHPGGDSRPSDADIRFSRRLACIAAELGISMHDHLVIAGAKWTSMRAIGALP